MTLLGYLACLEWFVMEIGWCINWKQLINIYDEI